MSPKQIIRAWKDKEYRKSLIAPESESPDNPAGGVELSEEKLAIVAGGLRIVHPQPEDDDLGIVYGH
jgi:mersacidin/lichenicidin family type 2 lantibiotic